MLKKMNLRKAIALLLLCVLVYRCSSNSDDTTPEPPATVETTITTTTPAKTSNFFEISVGGTISLGNDNFTVSERGVVWAASENPTINDNKELSNETTGTFSITISNLEAATLYYFRAYAMDGSDVIYGASESITTDQDRINGVNNFLPSAGDGKSWVLQPKFSNEFDYAEGKASTEFTNDWQDRFFNGWTGPKKSGTATTSTVYTPENSSIEDGKLVYRATIDGNNVHTGCITTKNKVGYPLYMEARVKISESSLATAVWLLSEDSTQEIDNLEAYGDKTNDYFSRRLHLSHHVFIRNPFQDYQPTGPETWYADGKGTQWADEYHDYGVLWLDPWTLKYYVDGELVRETPTNEIDPLNYTNGTGLNKDMYLILSAAAQPWRETANQVDDYTTDPSVTNASRSTARFEYVRTYKPE